MTSTPEIIRSRIIRQHSETRRLDTCVPVLSVIVPFVCVPVNTLNPTSGFASGLISVISFCEQPAMARAESANHTCFVFIFL